MHILLSALRGRLPELDPGVQQKNYISDPNVYFFYSIRVQHGTFDYYFL